MKFSNITLYFWSVFAPSIGLGLFLAFLSWATNARSGDVLGWIPAPLNIVLLFLLAVASTFVFFIFIYQVVNYRRDEKLRDILSRLAAGETADQARLISEGGHEHPLANLLLRFLQSSQRRESQLQKLSRKDLLTTFETQTGSVLLVTEKLQQASSPFDAIAIRINNLRIINDIYGFSHGNNCIVEIARRISKIHGTGIRMDSGDLLWLSETRVSKSELNTLVEALSLPVNSNGTHVSIDAYIGMVDCPAQADNCEALFRRAWLTLEQAVHSAIRIYHYDSCLDEAYLRRLLIIAELESVFTGNDSELSLFYQPKVNLHTGRVEAAEALIRWHNPVLGDVFPDEFITLAEQAGLLPKISFWVINQAVRDLVAFRNRDILIAISVNVSAHDITDTPLLEHAVSLLQAHGIHPSQLCFELTESQLLGDPERAVTRLAEFREHGFRVSIDDFGTGYSSLAYLKRLPIDELKIDKSFVLQLDTQPDDQSIVQTILTLAQRFHLSVVAEGVEVPKSLSLLHQWGCHWAQGYLVSRPLSQERFIEWFSSDESRTWQQAYLQQQ